MKCALIGERLGHSYSKLIHEAFGLYSYELVSLPKDKVGEFTIKIYYTIHYAMVGYGKGGLSLLLSRFNKLLYPACTIKQAVFGMIMKMCKSHS